MKVDKYYTPDISEFHIGFECEVYHEYLEKENHFEKEIYDALTPIWYDRLVEDLIENKQVQVKYLDKEDIESLGFEKDYKFNAIRLGYTEVYTKKIGDRTLICSLLINFEEHKMIILYGNFNSYAGDNAKVFKGVIKNKSELKILLKQIGI